MPRALREISAAKKEVPRPPRHIPAICIQTWPPFTSAPGASWEKPGSITLIPILTMPEDDKTHPIPDLTGYITEGQIILSRQLYRAGVNPPVGRAALFVPV